MGEDFLITKSSSFMVNSHSSQAVEAMRKSREADEAKKTRTAGEIAPEEIWDIYIYIMYN